MPRTYGAGRDKHVTFRVTTAERERLRQEAATAGLDVGEYVRARVGLTTSTPMDNVAAAYSTVEPDLVNVIAGLQEGIDNARALLEGRGKEGK